MKIDCVSWRLEDNPDFDDEDEDEDEDWESPEEPKPFLLVGSFSGVTVASFPVPWRGRDDDECIAQNLEEIFTKLLTLGGFIK